MGELAVRQLTIGLSAAKQLHVLHLRTSIKVGRTVKDLLGQSTPRSWDSHMIQYVLRFAGVFALSMTVAQSVQAGFQYVETSIANELSSDNENPTMLGAAMVGSNTVTGQVTAIGNGSSNTADIFSFVIPTGLQLDAIRLTSFSTALGSSNMFIALDDDAIFAFSATQINNFEFGNQVLGGLLIGNAFGPTIGSPNFLPALLNPASNGAGGAGGTAPLPAGTYTVYIQETGQFSNYSLSFDVTAVPEPSAAMFGVLLALGTVASRRRRTAAY